MVTDKGTAWNIDRDNWRTTARIRIRELPVVESSMKNATVRTALTRAHLHDTLPLYSARQRPRGGKSQWTSAASISRSLKSSWAGIYWTGTKSSIFRETKNRETLCGC